AARRRHIGRRPLVAPRLAPHHRGTGRPLCPHVSGRGRPARRSPTPGRPDRPHPAPGRGPRTHRGGGKTSGRRGRQTGGTTPHRRTGGGRNGRGHRRVRKHRR